MKDFLVFDLVDKADKLEEEIVSTIKSVLRENGKVGETFTLKKGYSSFIENCPIYLNRVCLTDENTLAFGGEVIRESAQELWVSKGHRVSTMPYTLIPQNQWDVDIRDLIKILFEVEIICRETSNNE